jgi:hypothetical protein
MNKQRRTTLAEINGQIAELREKLQIMLDEENEAYDNMPEGLQQSVRGEKAEAAISAMETAISGLDEAEAGIEEASE